MKKVFSTLLIAGMLVGWSAVASAAPEGAPPSNQQPGPAVAQTGTVQDKRIITPQMNARQRMEVQRAVQKRAAANRSALMAKAAAQEKQADEAAKSGHPVDIDAK